MAKQQTGKSGRRSRPPKPVVKQDNKNTDSASDSGPVEEIGGRDGLDPTRYGDWEKNGRCVDF
jgi:hypothetical protein